MLVALSIRDIVLIDKLDLSLSEGLCALTGETGAGKSILLDALGLAAGGRADAGLVAREAKQGSVAAVFDLAADHPARALASENDIDTDGDMILRRVQTRDGRSRAFINDQPVSIALLRQIGDLLVEIHGQHAERGLLDASSHRALLDAFAGHETQVQTVRACWNTVREARSAYEKHKASVEKAREEEDYLRHVVGELAELDPEDGEEASLADARALMMQSEKIAGDLTETEEALSGDGGFEARLSQALRRLARAGEEAQAALRPLTDALERTLTEAAEARAQLDEALRRLEFDPAELERIESRLFALRAAARKHSVPVDELPALRARLEAAVQDLEGGEERLGELSKAVEAAEAAYFDAAEKLSAARAAAAAQLDGAVMQELGPLKLDKARFSTRVDQRAREEAGPDGLDDIAFEVATNPGADLGPLIKIASGGELARFILALKVVLASRGEAATLIFDEVDAGVGGAVAEAVGVRLAELARQTQVLVVTHSPQVAARADHHYRISKAARDGAELLATSVARLGTAERREEIARMLAGATVTDEARAAADRLIGGV